MDDGSYYTTAPIDPTYGQRSALPDIYDEQDETTTEALTYLQSVRSEARTIPNLLVAEQIPVAEDKERSHLGFYEDGAYTGTAMSENLEPDMPENQQAYYGTLLALFDATRSSLTQHPPPITKQPAKISAILNFTSTHAQWLHSLLYTSPTTTELARASQEAIMLGLRRYESIVNKRNFLLGEQQTSCLGAWGWSLLAKCREVGQLDSGDVSTIRDVGKAIVRLFGKIPSSGSIVKESAEDAQEPDQADSSEENESSEIAEDKVCKPAAIITLDILITIIGEEFGQRDLLGIRGVW